MARDREPRRPSERPGPDPDVAPEAIEPAGAGGGAVTSGPLALDCAKPGRRGNDSDQLAGAERKSAQERPGLRSAVVVGGEDLGPVSFPES